MRENHQYTKKSHKTVLALMIKKNYLIFFPVSIERSELTKTGFLCSCFYIFLRRIHKSKVHCIFSNLTTLTTQQPNSEIYNLNKLVTNIKKTKKQLC